MVIAALITIVRTWKQSEVFNVNLLTSSHKKKITNLSKYEDSFPLNKATKHET